MSNRQLLEIGLVLMGLWFLTQVIISVPSTITMFSLQPSEVVPDPTVWAWATFASLIFYSLVGLAFLLFPRTFTTLLAQRLSDEKADISLSTQVVLMVGLVLIGAYFVISGLTGLVREIYGLWFSASTYQIWQFAANAVQLVLGLFLAMRPTLVVRWISVNKSLNTDASDAGAG